MQENERKEQQAQDISWEIEEEEPAEDTQEQGLLNITFIPKYMDIFDGLCATDQGMVPESGQECSLWCLCC